MASSSSSLIIICSLLLSTFCFAASNNNGGFTVDLIHRDSKKSPSYNPSSTRFQRIRSAFDRSFTRKSSFKSFLNNSIETPIISAGGEYVMEVSLGTPPVKQLGIADTGSDLLWTQCKPCTDCYKQNLPFFDPSESSSYRAVSCSSNQCAASGNPSCDNNNSCLYQVAYGDSSHSTGDIAFETLTFADGVSFPKVVFGCGHDNKGTFGEAGTGIIGLGGGSISIVNQLKSTIGGRFSYCLTFLNSNASSKISFGSNAVVGGDNVVSTPLVKKSPETFYFLTLEGMSVGTEGSRKYYSDESSSRRNGGDVEEGNIIIDSGTTLTFVPSEIYEGLESSLVQAIDGKRVSDPQGLFGLCYEVGSGEEFKTPTITAHFKGADIVLPERSTFVEIQEGVACLTVVESQDLAIFGNLHQINYQVGYDLVEGQVSFLPTDCSANL